MVATVAAVSTASSGTKGASSHRHRRGKQRVHDRSSGLGDAQARTHQMAAPTSGPEAPSRADRRSGRSAHERDRRGAKEPRARRSRDSQFVGLRWTCRASNPSAVECYTWRCTASGARAMQYRWKSGD
jgi:hypothetical protein